MSNNEYEQQRFWEEPYIKSIEQHFKDKLQQESEEWFSNTHNLIMKHLKQIKDGK